MIYVGNLPQEATALQTRSLFERYGLVLSMRLNPGDGGHYREGFGVVEMETTDARKAIAGIDGQAYQGAILSVREMSAASAPDIAEPIDPSTQPATSLHGSLRPRYELSAVEKVSGPGGASGEDWHRYVLTHRDSRIVGFRRGSIDEVTEYAMDCAEAFNKRSMFCRGAYPTRPQGRPRKA